MKNILAPIGLLAILGCLYFTFSGSTDSRTAVHDKIGLSGTSSQSIHQVYIPETMNFAGESVPLHMQDARERLDRELTSITFRHSSTIRLLKLANRWFPVLEPMLQRHGIPDDFKYLVVAESSLENLTSPAGARGFWQLMSATAKSYGMEISSDVEERYHVEKSTDAAAKYLHEAKRKFGTWTMAAASYNRGMAGMKGHIADQQENDYFDLHLNTETARYIYRILAFKQLMSNPSTYGFNLSQADFYPPFQYTTITIDQISDIATFCQAIWHKLQGHQTIEPVAAKDLFESQTWEEIRY